MSAATDYIQLTHAASEIDGTIDEVYAARGSYGNLSGRIASKQDELTEAQLAAANSGLTAAKLTADEAALVELVDSGAKNHCTMESGSNPSSDRWINIPMSDVGVGQWVMSFGTLTSTDTDDTLCQAICFNSSSQQVSNWVNFKREANTNKVFTTTDHVAYVRLYSANSYATSAGDTVTFTNAMLCTKAAWDISHKFVPYCPSMAEMYEMILALQNGTRSAPALAKSEPEEIKEPETGEEETR